MKEKEEGKEPTYSKNDLGKNNHSAPIGTHRKRSQRGLDSSVGREKNAKV